MGARKELEELAVKLGLGQNVVFLGPISEDQKTALLSSIDVLVIPAFNGFPITIFEAIKAGRPVVATNLAEDLAGLSDTVLYVTDEDPMGLALGILRVVEDPTVREALVAEGKRLISSKYSTESVVADLVVLYSDIVKFGDLHN